MTISNRQLREAFLSPQMQCYFERKLAPLSSEEVGIRIEETLKFLNIATFCHGSIPVTKDIDDVWHYWILETREYSQLCAALQGRQYIHHSSKVYLECGDIDSQASRNNIEEDVAMLGTYVLNYGPFEADRVKYWLLATHLVDKCGWSVTKLNDWLTSAAAVPLAQA
jgi:hypothetical protein